MTNKQGIYEARSMIEENRAAKILEDEMEKIVVQQSQSQGFTLNQ